MFIIKYWDLIKHLASREIKARYKQSFLGFFWVVLNPFFQMLIMSLVFSNILRIQTLWAPYPIFVYVGLLPWIFFANSIASSTGVLFENAALIKKIYFPREILVFSTLCAKAFDFLLAASIFIILMLYFHVPFSWYALLVIPIFIVQFIFAFGLSLLLSALNLFYRDIQYLFNLIITLWFYLTPVLYATEFFPETHRWIFKFNPMSVFINAYRQVLLTQSLPNWGSLAIGAGVALALFIFAYHVFKKLEGTFADVV